MLLPAITGSGASVLLTDTSADAVSVSVSVALLFPGVGSVTPPGSVTVAVLVRFPIADALIVAFTVYVTLLPDGMLTVSLMLPEPAAVFPVAPPAATLVYVTPLSMPGKVSATDAPSASLGPVLVTVIV